MRPPPFEDPTTGSPEPAPRRRLLDELMALRGAGSDFLAPLSDDELDDLRRELSRTSCPAGRELMRVGESGDRFYIVLEGTLEVLIRQAGTGAELVVNELGPGDVFGEMALVSGGTRTATIRSRSPCHLAALSADGFARLLERHVTISGRITELLVQRLRRTQLATHLDHLFGPLDFDTLKDLEAHVEWLGLPSGGTLFHEGEPSDAAYVLVHGRLRAVTVTPQGKERILGEVGRGETVGESAWLSGDQRRATVYAVRDSELARFPRSGFDRLIDRHPRAMVGVSRIVADRLYRQTSQPVNPHAVPSTLALVPARPDMALNDFAADLVRALGRHDEACLLSSASVDHTLGKPGIAQASGAGLQALRLTQWLDEREAIFRLVLYQTDDALSPWTERCLRQADQVLIVADADAEPAPGAIELRLAERETATPRRSLVLLQRSWEPAGTARWLAAREVDDHYHVRPGSAADLDRLARCLTGRAVGLVLGGGGARGVAHAGVLRALAELSIPVDFVGGTSMGSIFAGLHASGRRPEEILAVCRRTLSDLLDYTFPAVALFAGRRVGQRLRATFGEREIEDLWIPFFAVSTNLTRAEQAVHRRGRLADAIRASISLPVVFPPFRQGDDLLVDGGLLNNVPVDVMRELVGGGVVIAADVGQEVDVAADPRLTPELSGWKVLWSRLGRRPIRSPGLLGLLLRATEVGSVASRNRIKPLADLYLQPCLDEWGLLEFEAYEAIAERGYQETVATLEGWWQGRRPMAAAAAHPLPGLPP